MIIDWLPWWQKILLNLFKKIKENNNSNNNTVRSNQIKEFVTEEVKSRNENVIAKSFSGYSKNTITELSANHKYDSKADPTQWSHHKEHVKQKDSTNQEESNAGSPS